MLETCPVVTLEAKLGRPYPAGIWLTGRAKSNLHRLVGVVTQLLHLTGPHPSQIEQNGGDIISTDRFDRAKSEQNISHYHLVWLGQTVDVY
jgi:hypothetical protein